ncbi:MAG: hypothetical protein V1826_00205 [bacterium]
MKAQHKFFRFIEAELTIILAVILLLGVLIGYSWAMGVLRSAPGGEEPLSSGITARDETQKPLTWWQGLFVKNTKTTAVPITKK